MDKDSGGSKFQVQVTVEQLAFLFFRISSVSIGFLFLCLLLRIREILSFSVVSFPWFVKDLIRNNNGVWVYWWCCGMVLLLY